MLAILPQVLALSVVLGEAPPLLPSSSALARDTWSRGRLEECHDAAKSVRDWITDLECLGELLQPRPDRRIDAKRQSEYAAYHLHALENQLVELERDLAAVRIEDPTARRAFEVRLDEFVVHLGRSPAAHAESRSALRARAALLAISLEPPPKPALAEPAETVGPEVPPWQPMDASPAAPKSARPRRLYVTGGIMTAIGVALLSTMAVYAYRGDVYETRTMWTGGTSAYEDAGRVANRIAIGTGISGGTALLSGSVFLVVAETIRQRRAPQRR